jgi:hypothetical protein
VSKDINIASLLETARFYEDLGNSSEARAWFYRAYRAERHRQCRDNQRDRRPGQDERDGQRPPHGMYLQRIVNQADTAPGGAIAAIGTAGSQSRVDYNNALMAGFYRGFFNDSLQNIGWSLVRAKLELFAARLGGGAYEIGAQVLNFGAFIAFMGVNAAAMARFFFKAEKKKERVTTQGLVEAYIHTGGRIGAMVELNCETDFVARTDEFKALAHNIAMQVAALDPKYVSPDQAPAAGREGNRKPANRNCEQPHQASEKDTQATKIMSVETVALSAYPSSFAARSTSCLAPTRFSRSPRSRRVSVVKGIA